MPRRCVIEVEKDYFNFASAHFLVFANGKREALHDHNYQISVAVEGELDPAGVVLDFIVFKPVIKNICDELDDRTLIQRDRRDAVGTAVRAEQAVLENQLLIINERAFSFEMPKPSVTRKVSIETPDAVGVPVMAPEAELKRRPEDSAPDVNDQM